MAHVTCHIKYRCKLILIPSIDTSSSDAGIRNIDILALVLSITTKLVCVWYTLVHVLSVKAAVTKYVPYSKLFSWVENFHEKLEEALRIKFRGFKLHGVLLHLYAMQILVSMRNA